MKNDFQTPAIRLEPRDIFDRAIVGYTSDNWAVYDYEKLVVAVKNAHVIKNKTEAEEFTDYNILSFDGNGLLVTYRDEQP